ncbi:MAG TPA: AI-2E family transporter, partial [Longimicrobiales bacterium]
GPRIVGESVGLHPVWVILALAVGSFFFGFVGLLLAMPAAVFIKLIAREAVKRYRHSDVYEGEPA